MQDIDREADTELGGKEIPSGWRQSYVECFEHCQPVGNWMFSPKGSRGMRKESLQKHDWQAGVLLWHVGWMRIDRLRKSQIPSPRESQFKSNLQQAAFLIVDDESAIRRMLGVLVAASRNGQPVRGRRLSGPGRFAKWLVQFGDFGSASTTADAPDEPLLTVQPVATGPSASV